MRDGADVLSRALAVDKSFSRFLALLHIEVSAHVPRSLSLLNDCRFSFFVRIGYHEQPAVAVRRTSVGVSSGLR